MQTKTNTELNGHALVPFNSFLKQNGRSPSTGQRWRKRGWITTIDINGRLYVSHEEIERFHQRAAAGEFAQGHVPGQFVYDGPVAELLKKSSTANGPRETTEPATGEAEHADN